MAKRVDGRFVFAAAALSRAYSAEKAREYGANPDELERKYLDAYVDLGRRIAAYWTDDDVVAALMEQDRVVYRRGGGE